MNRIAVVFQQGKEFPTASSSKLSIQTNCKSINLIDLSSAKPKTSLRKIETSTEKSSSRLKRHLATNQSSIDSLLSMKNIHSSLMNTSTSTWVSWWSMQRMSRTRKNRKRNSQPSGIRSNPIWERWAPKSLENYLIDKIPMLTIRKKHPLFTTSNWISLMQRISQHCQQTNANQKTKPILDNSTQLKSSITVTDGQIEVNKMNKTLK